MRESGAHKTQNCDITGITEMLVDISQGWSPAMNGYSLFRKERWGGGEEGCVAIYIKAMYMYFEVLCEVEERPIESLSEKI